MPFYFSFFFPSVPSSLPSLLLFLHFSFNLFLLSLISSPTTIFPLLFPLFVYSLFSPFLYSSLFLPFFISKQNHIIFIAFYFLYFYPSIPSHSILLFPFFSFILLFPLRNYFFTLYILTKIIITLKPTLCVCQIKMRTTHFNAQSPSLLLESMG